VSDLWEVEFTVHAPPVPQGSKHARVSRNGKPFLTESSAAGLATWRGRVTEEAEKALLAAGLPMLAGHAFLDVVFTFPRPASHHGTGRNASVLKPSAPLLPSGGRVGDLSKLVRATEDALTDAGLWKDDSLVVCLTAWKVYPGGHSRAQGVPGAWVRVTEIATRESESDHGQPREGTGR
jgi:crossover junction endodeoxyribonuclease RusA